MSQRLAPGTVLATSPSIWDTFAPVTRPMMFCVVPAKALVNVALSPLCTLKSEKLWKRFWPTCFPTVFGIV